MFYIFFSVIILSPLLFIITMNLRKGIKKKEKVRDLLKKNRIYFLILMCAVIGLALSRLKFYMDYGI